MVRGATLALLAIVSQPHGFAEERQVVERTFTTWDGFDACLRDSGIDVSSAKGFVRLKLEDYRIHTTGNKLAGATPETGVGKKRRFSPELMGRKVFDLDAVEAEGAEIYIFGGTGKASCNGYPIEFKDFVHHQGWTRAEVQAAYLQRGRNEILFHDGFHLAQDRETNPPKWSDVSRDGGKTWQAAEGGEFLVHLRLRRYPTHGVITSTVVDLANPEDKDILCPMVSVRRVWVEPQAFDPGGTSVAMEGRTGTTPWPDETWSQWRAAKNLAPARFVQWRATLRTKDHSKTPVLARVAVGAELDGAAGPATQGAKLRQFLNQRIVRSTYPYGFQRPSKKLERLREQYRLDEVIAPGKTEFEQYVLLRNWARRQWPCNDGFGGTWDALDILSAPAGKKGMCVHFATLFAQCALALGFNARQIVIHHHFVADVWSNTYQTWALMDVEGVYPPCGFQKYGTAHYIDPRSKRPLNCLEIHRACHRAIDQGKDTVDDVIQVYSFDTPEGPYVPHDMKRSPAELSPFERFAYPPRNDYLDKLDPWEEYHGQDHYHSNSYLWWDSEWPEASERQYSWRSNRAGDFYWTINQAHLILTATDTPGRIAVMVDTVTPNFKEFLCRRSGGAWETIRGAGPDADAQRASFLWELKPGANSLDVKPVNRFGREGIVSSAAIEMPSTGAPR